MYGLVLFDLDGTLTDSKEGIVNSIRYALDSFGLLMPDAANIDKFLGPPIRDSFREFCGVEDEKMEAVVAKYREYLVKRGLFENQLYDGIEDVIEKLDAKGVKMAVATSKATLYAEKILKYFEIDSYFGCIMGCELDGARSDKAEIIGCVLDELDSNRKMKAVMIGDRKHDIIGAAAHNIDSIGVLWGYGSRAELEAAGAAKIANSTKELSHIITGV